ncbi:MAG: adenylate/guanylate cyclase domain-containing protein [Spirochaetota bacterium]
MRSMQMLLVERLKKMPIFAPIPPQHYLHVKTVLAHSLFWNASLALGGLISATAIIHFVVAQETSILRWKELLALQYSFSILALAYLTWGERFFRSVQLRIASVFFFATGTGILFGLGLVLEVKVVSDAYRLVTIFALAVGVTGAASFTFTVSPATFLGFCLPFSLPLFGWLWQTAPNESGKVLAALALNYFAVIFLLVLREYRRRVNLILAELSLKIERERSDALLLNILPRAVADDLRLHGKTEPQVYQSATVLFTDFVGFTRISEKMTPRDLIDELDKCFSYFDQVTEKYRLEKLKTIGDSFMCAGGLPKSNRTHAIDCCLAALEIQSFMRQMREIKQAQGLDYWELRVGIHTGPLVAGVVGHKKFAYDVWGDTVNTASRLEASGIPGEVNISGSTHEAVRQFFTCEARGYVAAKNKGDIEMYLVKGLTADYARDTECRVPNEAFRKIYKSIMRGKAPS